VTIDAASGGSTKKLRDAPAMMASRGDSRYVAPWDDGRVLVTVLEKGGVHVTAFNGIR
jgi:hypothetical protein